MTEGRVCCAGCDVELDALTLKANYKLGRKRYCRDCWLEVQAR